MTTQQKLIIGSMITIGSAAALLGFFAFAGSSAGFWLSLAGIVVSQSSVLLLAASSVDQQQHDQDVEDSPSDRQQKTEELIERERRLEERERDLSQKLARFQEFLEYPQERDLPHDDAAQTMKLSEQDRRVHELLEAEAERVYNRIRVNAYLVDGAVDVATIRSDAVTLIRNIAQIYSPDSQHPLLETSFEQLARSASRICLHALVLLERLPLDVKSYNINQLHGYLRKAVQSYGTWQQVTPWLKHLSRAAYGGRLAAGANPLTLGAWWLATEVGRRGAQKVVENVVDRQAIAVLHDIITVIGVEAANVYGPGIRQRSAAWVYGAELAELLTRFPVSREALQQGLKEVTALPLHSEYDRIYLYRCVAGHRSAGLRIRDAASLSRTERDRVARQLEHFFDSYIHGATPKDTQAWREDVESRLDLKLHPGQSRRTNPHQHNQAEAAIQSLYDFMTQVIAVTPEDAVRQLEVGQLLPETELEQRTTLLNSLPSRTMPFEPPDLDPAAPLTDAFLKEVMDAVVQCGRCDEHLEHLALETAQYFRRTHEQAVTLLTGSCRRTLETIATADVKIKSLNAEHMKAIIRILPPGRQINAVYDGISLKHGEHLTPCPADILIVTTSGESDAGQLMLISSAPAAVLWRCESDCRVQRRKGYIIDDCEIIGGQWLQSEPQADAIIIAGSVTGGGFDRTFAAVSRGR
ncbi:MAG: hypothetical protein R3C49_03405 [Planctomycetaceae bacterium]